MNTASVPVPVDPHKPVVRHEDTIGARDLAEWRTAAGRWVERQGVVRFVRLPEHWALFIPGIIGAALMTLATFGATETYESVKSGLGLARLDGPVLRWMVARRTPTLDNVVTAYTQTGGPALAPIITAIVVGLLAWRWRSWTPVILASIAVIGSLAMTLVGKRLGGRARPDLIWAVPPYENSPSLPSGHALNAMVVAGVVSYLLFIHLKSRWAKVLTAVLAALYTLTMGMSRVFLGHHWLSDVVMGWVLGAAWLAVFVTVHRLALTVRRRQAEVAGATAPALAPPAI